MEWLFSHRSKNGFPLTGAAVCCMHWIFYGISIFVDCILLCFDCIVLGFYCAWIVLCLYARCTVFPMPSDFIAIQSLSFVILYIVFCIFYLHIVCILSVYCIVLCLYCILLVLCVYGIVLCLYCILCVYCVYMELYCVYIVY